MSLRILKMYQHKFGYFKLHLLSITIDSYDNMALLKICKLKTFHGKGKDVLISVRILDVIVTQLGQVSIL